MGAVSKCVQVSVVKGVALKVLNKKMKEVEAPEDILHGGVGENVSPGTISTGSGLSHKWNWWNRVEGRPT